MLQLAPSARQRFTEVQERMRCTRPTQYQKALDLARDVVDPQTACPSKAWEVIWTKPLFANRKTCLGETWTEALKATGWAAWENWPNGRSSTIIAGNAKGMGRSNDRWDITGPKAKELAETGILYHRLWQIQQAASVFQTFVEKDAARPVAFFADHSLAMLVVALRARFGKYWGHTTVLHVLADFGLAVKPDIHVVRSLGALGVDGLPNEPKQVSALTAVALVELLKGTITPGGAFDAALPKHLVTHQAKLRYLDAILLHASAQKLWRG